MTEVTSWQDVVMMGMYFLFFLGVIYLMSRD